MINSFLKFRLLIVLSVIFFQFAFPTNTFAICPSVTPTPPQNFEEVVCFAVDHITPLIYLVVSLSLLVFFWGVAKFILAAGDEKKIQEGKILMFWGVVALFVMVSFWGIIQLLHTDFFGGKARGLPLFVN